MRQAGLESDSSDQSSDPQTSDLSAERGLGPVLPRTANGSKDGKNGRSRHRKRSSDHIDGQAADERQPAERSRNALPGRKRSKLLGPLAVSEDPAKALAAGPGRSGGRPRGSLEQEAAEQPQEEQELEGSEAEEGATAFDYLAARAAAPGLDLDLAAQSTRGKGRGRGQGEFCFCLCSLDNIDPYILLPRLACLQPEHSLGQPPSDDARHYVQIQETDSADSAGDAGRGRGRGGAGQRGRHSGGRGQPAAPSPYSLYQLDESKMLKGGKRSAVMPRSGNRTLTFG